MCAIGMKLFTDLLRERPGRQGVGHGRQRITLVKARGGRDLMPLAAGIPPNMGRRFGVPCVKVWGKVREVCPGLVEGRAYGGVLEGSP
eukprot:8452910-Alexandrium_andersonii.AAC.1